MFRPLCYVIENPAEVTKTFAWNKSVADPDMKAYKP